MTFRAEEGMGLKENRKKGLAGKERRKGVGRKKQEKGVNPKRLTTERE
jgi:hypothetical protein